MCLLQGKYIFWLFIICFFFFLRAESRLVSLCNTLFLLLPLVLVLTLLSFNFFFCSVAFTHSFPVMRGDIRVISVSVSDAFFRHFLLQ